MFVLFVLSSNRIESDRVDPSCSSPLLSSSRQEHSPYLLFPFSFPFLLSLSFPFSFSTISNLRPAFPARTRSVAEVEEGVYFCGQIDKD